MSRVEHSLPAFQQIARHYAEQIARGNLRPGDKLPSERELMDAWNVSKATANKVTAALKSEGLASSRVGSGTVVADQSGPVGVGPRDMFRRIRFEGRIRLPGERSIRTIGHAEGSSVPGHVVQALNGTSMSEFIWRRRVILRDEQPFSVATSWFLPAVIGAGSGNDAGIVARLLKNDAIEEGTPLFIAKSLGTELREANDFISAIRADEELSADLGVEAHSPALYIVSTMYAEGWGPIEAGEYFYPAGSGVNYRHEV